MMKRITSEIMFLFVIFAIMSGVILFYPQEVWANTDSNDKQYISDTACIIDDNVESELNDKINGFYDETCIKLMIFTMANTNDFKATQLIMDEDESSIIFIVPTSGEPKIELGTYAQEYLSNSEKEEILQNNFDKKTEGSNYTEEISSTVEAVMKEIGQKVEKRKAEQQKNSRNLLIVMAIMIGAPLILFVVVMFVTFI